MAMNRVDVSHWKKYKVSEVFDCSTTKAVAAEDIIAGDTPYITRSAIMNGFSGLIPYDESKINKGNCITVGAEGVLAFYQDVDFLAGVKIYTLRNKNLNKYNALFICTILNVQKYKYSYGRARVLDKLKNEDILLPATNEGEPDFEYMTTYVKSVWGGSYKTSIPYSKQTLSFDGWKEFELQEIFDIKYGINMELNSCVESDDLEAINFVSRTELNNGVSSRVLPVEGKEPQDPGLITCAGGGSVLSTFLQEEPFYSGRDLYLLKAKDDISKYAKLFIITIIKANKYRYSYGRQANITLPFLKIKLPVLPNRKPNYQFMENYMKKLQYSDLI